MGKIYYIPVNLLQFYIHITTKYTYMELLTILTFILHIKSKMEPTSVEVYNKKYVGMKLFSPKQEFFPNCYNTCSHIGLERITKNEKCQKSYDFVTFCNFFQ